MAHKIPAVRNRVFSTLVITASTTPEHFIVAQVPVDIRDLDEAYYSNDKHLKDSDSTRKKKVVVGAYASVETCLFRPGGNGTDNKNEGVIEWVMTTASDAKGWIPMPLQKPKIPGAIAADVGYFIGWAMKRRT
jgi:hypothetical protein